MQKLTNTLNFLGRTEEAVQLYEEVLDADVLFLMRIRDSPESGRLGDEFGDRIFHVTFRVASTELMASDLGCETGEECRFAGFSLAISVDDMETAERFFGGLAATGSVKLPMAETFFARRYGIVIDQFGISWKIVVPTDESTRPKQTWQ